MSYEALPNIDDLELDLHGTFYTSSGPVQAWGTLQGYEFYFRSRFEDWYFAVSESPDIDAVDIDEPNRRFLFLLEGQYGTGPFDASYMPLEFAAQLIRKCASEYVQAKNTSGAEPRMNWRNHSQLKPLFSPEYPDDLQIIVHDGGPRLTDKQPELIWVRVTGQGDDIFVGRVLNQPVQLESIEQGYRVLFIMPKGSEHPMVVTAQYMVERSYWKIHPCVNCGFSELFDLPSSLIRVLFPNIPDDAVMESFTSFCPLCSGAQVLEFQGSGNQTLNEQPEQTPWVWFWKK
jgi:hypothetical protein